MKRLNVEFLPEAAWRRWWPTVLLILALAAAGFESVQAWRAHARLIKAEAALDEARERHRAALAAQASSAPASAPEESPAQQRWRAEIERMRAFDMDAVLNQIEAARVVGVKATAIDIDPPTHIASIDIEATSLNDVLAYLDALNAGDPACRWSLDRASDSNGKEVARFHCSSDSLGGASRAASEPR